MRVFLFIAWLIYAFASGIAFTSGVIRESDRECSGYRYASRLRVMFPAYEAGCWIMQPAGGE